MKKSIIYKLLFALLCVAIISYFLACRYYFAPAADNRVCNNLNIIFHDKDVNLISSDFIEIIENKKFWNAQIEQIYVRSDKKIELITRVGDAVVVLGRLDDYEKKLEKLERIYFKVFDKIGWNHYKTINLEYKGQVVCTKGDL